MKQWDLYDRGYRYAIIEAPTVEAALADAVADVDHGHYRSPDIDGTVRTVWVEVCAIEHPECPDHPEGARSDQTKYAWCEVAGCGWETDLETAITTVQVDPTMPTCTDEHGHVWGWDGTVGHGGGVIVTETCERCGLTHTLNTWATNPTTGEQGLAQHTYRPAEEA